MNDCIDPPDQGTISRAREALPKVEQEEKVRVLYACESGSRAWGFASSNSDFDVRFIYVHPRDWYLSIDDRRDVIELPIAEDVDVSGWDLWKALRLLQKSNPPLLEWLKSPIIYRQDEQFANEFRAVAAKFHSPRRCFGHYLHMASGNWRRYLAGRERVSLKKYLYVLRPLMACRWIHRNLGQVPMLFQELVDAVLDEPDVRAELNQLVSRFTESEIQRLELLNEPEDSAGNIEELNILFRKYVLADGS